ncbi:MAG TPA: DUF4214 domain-containing protein [Pirellulales bacterium]|nr:DUF4214 domain-containing protein [Pirellulales bacterium]
MFRTPKGVNSRLHRRHRRRSAQASRLAGRIESLEPRSLLSGTSWSVSPVTFSAQEGSPVGSPSTAVQVATITDSSGTLSAANFAATINWGDGTTSTGTVATTAQSGTFAVQGTHLYSEEGNDSVRVTVTHINGSDSPVALTETVAVSDPAVIPTGGLTFTAIQSAAPATQLLATFTDPGDNEATSDYTAHINWGDFGSTTGTITFNPSGNDFLVTAGSGHIYTQQGTFTVSVTISHDQAPNATTTSTAIVSQPSVIAQGGFTYTGLEGGVPFNETVATFTDPAGAQAASNYSATIVWGDGTTTSGVISRGSGGVFSVVGNHAFAEEGSGPLEVVINHGTSLPVTVTGSYTIADAPVLLTAPALPIAANEGTPLVNVMVATFVDQGGPEEVDDYSIEIDWGDGSVSAGTVSFNAAAGNFTVVGNHTYSEGGRQPITITLHHDALSPDPAVLASANVTVPAVKPTGGVTFAATESLLSANQPVATFTDPAGAHALSEYSATIDWGDGSTPGLGTITFNANTGVFTVSGRHAYAEEGSYPLTVTVDHTLAPTATAISTAKVADPAVVATGGAVLTASEFRLFGPQTLAVFTDPAGNEPVSDYSATINWGDGTSSPGTIALNASGTVFSVLGSHTFSHLGSQTVSVIVHHDSAPDATVQSTVNVGLPPIILTTSPLTWRAWSPLEAPDNALATISFVDSTTTVTIDWGDGATSLGSVSPYVVGGAGAALGSHTWTETGHFNVTVTVNDGSSHAAATFPVTVIQNLLPIPNPSQATPNEYYVAKLYEDILKRFVDGGGLLFWSSLLDRGVPRSAVVSSLVNSDEYLTNFVINPAYEEYLGRPADVGGTQFWLSQIHAGLTDEGLAASLAGSPEFYLTAGGGTNLGFVDALYRVVLGRAPDSAGETFWVNRLAAGATTFSVALGFVTSGEDKVDFIQQTYLTLLQRTPTPAELNQWVANLQLGLATHESLITSLASSDEYYNLAVTI